MVFKWPFTFCSLLIFRLDRASPEHSPCIKTSSSGTQIGMDDPREHQIKYIKVGNYGKWVISELTGSHLRGCSLGYMEPFGKKKIRSVEQKKTWILPGVHRY